jgi:hypothetical protein
VQVLAAAVVVRSAMRELAVFFVLSFFFMMSSWAAERPNIIFILADDLG